VSISGGEFGICLMDAPDGAIQQVLGGVQVNVRVGLAPALLDDAVVGTSDVSFEAIE
jgi:hypothetical protein